MEALLVYIKQCNGSELHTHSLSACIHNRSQTYLPLIMLIVVPISVRVLKQRQCVSKTLCVLLDRLEIS